MELLKPLREQVCNLALRAIHAEMAVAHDSVGKKVISTAVVFDNIRIDTTLLRRMLVSGISAKQKLAFLAATVNDGARSFFDFLSAAADDSLNESESVAKHLIGLIHILEVLHAISEKISVKLQEISIPVSKYSPELFTEMTSRVQKLLDNKSVEHAKAIRNYALLEEVVIFAKSMIEAMNLFQATSSSL
eukprot:gene4821-21137_t